MIEQFLILEKDKKEFQMALNQWRIKYDVFIIWMVYDKEEKIYRALIKRKEKAK